MSTIVDKNVGGELEIVLIHARPDLLNATAALLNHQWPVSNSIRLMRLKESCDDLPIHVVGLDVSGTVVAHAKLSILGYISNAVLIESVVVDPSKRRLGFGALIMRATESLAKDRGYSLFYLSTKDQVEFYRASGYEECPPVSSLGKSSRFLNSDQVSALASLFSRGSSATREVWMKKISG